MDNDKSPQRLTCAEVRESIFNFKYKHSGDTSISDMFRRVAQAVAQPEGSPELRQEWEDEFFRIMDAGLFLGAGRIISNAGTDRPKATMCNCYVIGDIPDSMDGIFERLHQSALIMQAGGGIGMDFSSLRPKGAAVKGTGSVSSGPMSFAQTWDAMCGTIEAAGSRRGAQMGVMRVDHPDIDLFIVSKKKDEVGKNALERFNLSVAVTDDFMEAVQNDLDWTMHFNGKNKKTVKAAELWDRIMKSNYWDWEPGVLFIDRINQWNNLWYCENIRSTNPCGEQPLPPWGSCNLGAIVLPAFVENPFFDMASFDYTKLEETVKSAVRFLDNVLEINYYPLPEIKDKAMDTRRMGLGIIGLADTLAMMGMRYGSEEAIKATEDIMRHIRDAAYRASIELAREKGVFPAFDSEKYLQGRFIQTLPEDIQSAIKKYGIRNSHLLTVAPTGTISMLCGNMTSGVEPYFGIEYQRTMRIGPDESKAVVDIMPYSVELYRQGNGNTPLPDYILESVGDKVHYKGHIRMQAAAQKYVDSSISKTITFPEDISYEDFKEAYMLAYELGLKGCTTYRPNKGMHGIIKAKTEVPEIEDKDALPEVPDVLDGRRYKVKLPDFKHAYYIQINDITEGGRKRPFEIFINTKDPTNQEYMVALTRMISAVFRRAKDPSFVAEELKEIQSKMTAFWNAKRRKHMPSLMAEIGHVVQDHLNYLGIGEEVVPIEVYEEEAKGYDKPTHAYCPKCGQFTLVKQESCEFCVNSACNYDRCG